VKHFLHFENQFVIFNIFCVIVLFSRVEPSFDSDMMALPVVGPEGYFIDLIKKGAFDPKDYLNAFEPERKMADSMST